ncbi:hypothetical protein GFL77_05155 [Rhizobium leguminosarum bv. viciae]|nr:hypothetical protein [Rhizobium leguminosarum bv. viciae]
MYGYIGLHIVWALATAKTGSNAALAGADAAAAMTDGIRAAFLCGAIISIALDITAFFVRTPAGEHATPRAEPARNRALSARTCQRNRAR